MSTPEPCSETWILHAGARIAAESMGLAGITQYDTPADCANSVPEVFAALIQTQAIDRLAEILTEAMDALAPLERIADALEAGGGVQELPEPSATPAVPEGGGWITDRLPTLEDADADGEVYVLSRLPGEHRLVLFAPWQAVYPGTPWGPC